MEPFLICKLYSLLPGLSHGGACGNALLKVFYDMELETNNKNLFANYTNTANLFDDDDEEDAVLEGMNEDFGENGDTEKSFESLVTHDINSPSSITWAELLRRMKDEIHEIGHFQVSKYALTFFEQMEVNIYTPTSNFHQLSCKFSITGTFHNIFKEI